MNGGLIGRLDIGGFEKVDGWVRVFCFEKEMLKGNDLVLSCPHRCQPRLYLSGA